jgi:CheY-like chemotaxis protein
MTLPLENLHDARERLTALATGATAAEDALEPALSIIMHAASASAGAVCLFDPGEGLLSLAAEVGLSDEGCRRLRKVSRAAGAWATPLESLLARRIRVIDRASGASLPPLIEPAESISSVACLPLHVNGTPCASVVLVAVEPSTFGPDALVALGPALAELAKIVEGIAHRAAGGKPAARPVADGALAGVRGAARKVLHLFQPPRAPKDETAVVPPPFGREQEQQGGDVRSLRAEREELLLAREAAEHAHAAEIAHLTTRLSDTERSWAREHSLRVEQEHRLARERQRSETERDATVRRAVELVEAAEALRAAAVAEAEATRAALVEAQRFSLEAKAEARRARADAEAHEAAVRGASAEREQRVRALDEARARAAQAATSASQLEARVAALAEQEAAARAREAEAEARWQARLAQAEGELERERERVRALEGDRERLSAQREAAAAAELRLREQLDAVVKQAGTEREEILRRALEIKQRAEEARAAAAAELEAVRAALAEAQRLILDAEAMAGSQREAMHRYAAGASREAEEARAAAVAELETVRAALAEAQTESLAAASGARQARADTERLAAEQQAALAEAERLATAVQEARASLAEPIARVAQLEEDVRTLREQCQQVETAAREREAEAEARWLARLGEIETACASERDHAAGLERELARHAHELAEVRTREQHSRELLAAVTEDRDEVVAHATEIARAAEEARAAAAAEAEAIRASLANAQGTILQAEDETNRVRAEIERREAELRAAITEREQLARTLDEARARLAAGEQAPGRAAAPAPARAPAPAAPAAPRTEPSAAARGRIAVLDGSGAFAPSSGPNMHVEVVAAGPGLAARLAPLDVGRVLVNLAAPGALEAVATLRTDGHTGALSACLAAPGVEVALSLGAVEVTGRPLDPDAVLALLAGHASRGGRILAVGTSSSSMLGLRQALSRAGLSMAIAWDAKQASDLLDMVRPDLVIVDLALPGRAGHGIVAEIAALEPLPALVLVPGEGDDAAGFAAALAGRVRRPYARPRAQALRVALAAGGR